MKTLLENKANPDLQDTQGQTPLLAALDWDTTDAVATLLQYNADVSLKEHEQGHTPSGVPQHSAS